MLASLQFTNWLMEEDYRKLTSERQYYLCQLQPAATRALLAALGYLSNVAAIKKIFDNPEVCDESRK